MIKWYEFTLLILLSRTGVLKNIFITNTMVSFLNQYVRKSHRTNNNQHRTTSTSAMVLSQKYTGNQPSGVYGCSQDYHNFYAGQCFDSGLYRRRGSGNSSDNRVSLCCAQVF
ncbi:hypothetical protein KQH27_00865, partial [bacterium]|nr:hypothetical protein [bacterium]